MSSLEKYLNDPDGLESNPLRQYFSVLHCSRTDLTQFISEMAEDNSKCTSLSQSFSLDLILKTKVSELVEMAI